MNGVYLKHNQITDTTGTKAEPTAVANGIASPTKSPRDCHANHVQFRSSGDNERTEEIKKSSHPSEKSPNKIKNWRKW